MTENTIARPEPREIMDPRTGKSFDLVTADDERIAELLAWIRELEAHAREAKRAITEVVLERMDRDAAWSGRRAGPFELSGTAPGGIDYDTERLRSNLAGLVKNGLISQAAADAAVEPVTEHKVRKRGVSALRKLGKPEIDEALKASEVPAAAARRVSVWRVDG